jgi:hypothetical protein
MSTTTQFDEAVKTHQLMLETYGEDDPRTIEAILLVMLLAPADLFAEIEQMACSSFH